jgi:recombinational DNA repair protein RecR
MQNEYQRNLITTAEADALTAQGEYKKAATLYARCNKPFEEVALAFVDQHETDALRSYLTQKLVNLGRNVFFVPTIADFRP